VNEQLAGLGAMAPVRPHFTHKLNGPLHFAFVNRRDQHPLSGLIAAMTVHQYASAPPRSSGGINPTDPPLSTASINKFG